MLLAIDVGNTEIEFGVFRISSELLSFRMGTNRDITSDELGLFVIQYLMHRSIRPEEISDVIIASVVPQIMHSLSNAVIKYLGRDPLVVGVNIFPRLRNLYEPPSAVGSDRLVNSVAAHKKYGGPLIIVDFGTATTFDVVDEDGSYLGGVIYPGVNISMDALFQKAALLPRIELRKPPFVIGRNTVESMQSGIIHGYIGAVINVTELITKELGKEVKIVATGGMSRMFDELADLFDVVDRQLTLYGLKIIYEDQRENTC